MVTFENVYQNFSYHDPKIQGKDMVEYDFKGHWSERCFKNENPLVLELACGGGEYTINLARNYPSVNFVGIDIKGARIYKGAVIGLEEGLENAAFLRTRIELINSFFADKEVSEIWITFPDPFMKDSDENNRLTSPNFLRWIIPTIEIGGLLHLKTDCTELYEYTREILIEHPDLEILIDENDIYSVDELAHPALAYKTHYEEMHLAENKKIKYLQATRVY